MVEDLLNLVRREVARALTLRAGNRVGIVDSYDPSTHSVKVRYQPEDTLSGWLPVGTMRSGNGAGVHFAPNIGDQVVVHPLEDVHEAGIVGPRLYSTADQPLNVPAGEMWIVDDQGTSIKLTNDGNASISTPGDLSISVQGNLTQTVQGDMTIDVTGNLTITAGQVNQTGDTAIAGGLTTTEDVVAGTISLQDHIHSDPQGGSTGPPTG